MEPLLSLRPCPQCGTACDAQHQYCPGCGFPIGSIGTDNGDQLVGQTLPGGYQVLDLLSVGGMGRVYRAEQRALRRTVAVKVIHPHLLSDENSIVRFMTEARAASQLNHPNSVSVIDFGKTEDGQPYLVMEFLRGKDLARVAYEQGPLPFPRIANVLQQVLQALAEAHELQIVHRDLKPENILLEPMRRGGDFVKVVDFGLAKLKADPDSPNVTMPGIVCGTPDYMAPEQGRGDPIDGRSDLYGLGVVLFQLLTGRLPFESENPTQVVLMHLSNPMPDPCEVAPDRNIPACMVQVVSKALQKKADDRYQDAIEFADALADAAAELQAGSLPAGASMRPGALIRCDACLADVPATRFCGDCGERLATRGERETSKVDAELPELPLRLYEREDDLAWLQSECEQKSLNICALRIVGEAGVGKTRLLREFLRTAKQAGDLVVEARPDPYWAEVSFYTLREAIYGLIGVRDRTGSRRQWRDAREEEQRGLATIFGTPFSAGEELSAEQRRDDIGAAFCWALERAASRASGKKVVVAVEDLERVDTASLQAMSQALSIHETNQPIIFLTTHSHSFDPGWGGQSSTRALQGLTSNTLGRLFSGGGAKGGLLSHVSSRGVPPLYAEQVVRFLLEGGSEPPAGLADLIAHRLGTLPPAARQLLQAVAVLGERAEISSVQSLVGNNADPAPSILQLTDKDMLVCEGQELSISHPLIRELVLQGTPAEVRRELHRRTLGLLDRLSAPLEARAIHCVHAGESMEALMLLEQISDRAMARGDVGTAVSALRRALSLSRQELSRGELDDPMRAMVIFGRKLGDALTEAGDYADADGVLREALDMAGPVAASRAQLLASLARVARKRSRSGDAEKFYNEALSVARNSGAVSLVESLVRERKIP